MRMLSNKLQDWGCTRYLSRFPQVTLISVPISREYKRRPPSLSELTQYYIPLGLTHLGSEATNISLSIKVINNKYFI